MKKIIPIGCLSLATFSYFVYTKDLYKSYLPDYELEKIQSDYFMLLRQGKDMTDTNLIKQNDKIIRKKNFINHLKYSLEEHIHYIPKHMDYNKPEFYKDYIAVRKIRFNKDLQLTNSNQIFQGAMYSFIDTHLGSLAAQLYKKKPVVTAHIKYNAFKKIDAQKDYWIVSFADRMVQYQMIVLIKQ